jgi:hypothetical protein
VLTPVGTEEGGGDVAPEEEAETEVEEGGGEDEEPEVVLELAEEGGLGRRGRTKVGIVIKKLGRLPGVPLLLVEVLFVVLLVLEEGVGEAEGEGDDEDDNVEGPGLLGVFAVEASDVGAGEAGELAVATEGPDCCDVFEFD